MIKEKFGYEMYIFFSPSAEYDSNKENEDY